MVPEAHASLFPRSSAVFAGFTRVTNTWTVASKLTDQLSLSSMSQLVSVQSRAKVAQWLYIMFMDCMFMLKNRDSLIFELGVCFSTQGSPC